MCSSHGRRFRSVLVVGSFVICILVSATRAFGQIETGRISGVITDESGAALPGVTITVRNLSTGQTRSTSTNQDGRYQVSALRASKYSITADLSGFASVLRADITVNVGSALDVDIVMKLAALQETVTVTGGAALVESKQTDLSNVITEDVLESLPSKQRAFLDFTLLMPATVENVSSDGGTGAVIGGARTKEGAVLVDGFYNMDEVFANTKQRHSQDVIQEFQILTFGGSAEYGRAIGGVINAITKSGGNAFNGSAYGFFRDTSLNAQDWGEKLRGTPRTDYTRQQWGGTFGGPIRRNKSFFFLAYERLTEDWPFDNGIRVADGAIIGLPPEDVGTVPRYYKNNFVFGKWDHQLTDNQRVQASVSFSRNFDHMIGFQPRPLATRSAAHIQNTIDVAYQAKWMSISSSGRNMHELKVSYFPRRYDTSGLQEGGPPLVPDGQINLEERQSNSSIPRVTIANVAEFGSVSLNNLIHTDPIGAIYTSSLFKEKHSVKFGADYMNAAYRYERYSSFRAVYAFSSLANFQRGAYNTYTQSFGDPANDRAHQYMSAFVQDSWEVGRRMTMNYGLRYDLELNPKHEQSDTPFGNDYNNFGPRLGISYDLTDKRTTFLKLTTGVYYDRIWGNATNNFYTLKGHETLLSSTWTPTTPGAPVYPQVFTEQPATLPAGVRNATLMPEDVRIPTTAQAVATVDHSFTSNLALSGSVIYSRSWYKEYQWDANLVWDEASQRYTRPDPNYLRVTQFRYDAPAEYTGGIVELNARGVKLGFNGNLTFARAYQTTGFSGSPNEPRLGIKEDWGPVPESPAVRGVVSGWYNLTSAIQISGVFRARTGFAVNPVAAGLDLNGDAVFGDRTPTLEPFSFRMAGANSVDLRLSWSPSLGDTRKLQLYVESFNLFNRKDVRTVLNSYGPDPAVPGPRWMEPSSYFPPREVQLGARLVF